MTILKNICTTNKSDIKSVDNESSIIDSSGDKTAAFNRMAKIVANCKEAFDDDDDVTVTTSGNSCREVGLDDSDSPPGLVANNNDSDSSDHNRVVTPKQQGKKKKKLKHRRAQKSQLNSTSNNTFNSIEYIYIVVNQFHSKIVAQFNSVNASENNNGRGNVGDLNQEWNNDGSTMNGNGNSSNNEDTGNGSRNNNNDDTTGNDNGHSSGNNSSNNLSNNNNNKNNWNANNLDGPVDTTDVCQSQVFDINCSLDKIKSMQVAGILHKFVG